MKLQSEIDKNKAEAAEIKERTKEIEKRLNQRKIFGIPIYQTLVGGIVAGVFIITFSWQFLTPILNKDSQIAQRKAELLNIENKLERVRIDSLNIELTAQKRGLEEQVQLITARLDSTVKQLEGELRLVTARLLRTSIQTDSNPDEINRLRSQASKLNEDIRNTKSEKEQIRTIVPAHLSSDDVTLMIKTNNYYDKSRNPMGMGVENKFKHQPGDSVVYDAETRLTWQNSGSPEPMLYEEKKKYIARLNASRFAGFTDWRLPTLKEAMSLIEAFTRGPVFTDPVFDAKQPRLLTSDTHSASAAWGVTFTTGSCYNYDVGVHKAYVRAVR